jgi:sugar phosphate permease
MAVKERRGFHWAWVILATVFVDLFINYSVRIGYGVVLPEMISNLGFSRTGVGSIYNSYLCLCCLHPFGYLTDRVGARMLCGMLSVLRSAILMGTINTL